jgi:hypothetical protein
MIRVYYVLIICYRFYPKDISDLVLKYLVLVKPFEQ